MDLLDIKQFKDSSPTCVAFNETSGVGYLNNKEVVLLELFKDGCQLELPSKSCAVGHKMVLFFFPDSQPRKFKRIPGDGLLPGSVRVRTLVKEVQGDKERLSIRVSFDQYSHQEWDEYLQKIFEKKKESFQMIIKMKG